MTTTSSRKAWGKENGLGARIDGILNRTPLTETTNRDVIRSRLPNEYLPELVAATDEATVRQILESHFISSAAFDILLKHPFTSQDFEMFLAERQHTIQDAIEDLLVKSRLQLPPRLRELDAHIEEIELNLRQLVTTTLQDDPAILPGHVQQKIKGRVQAAFRTSPGLDMTAYDTLIAQLEFADLSELKDTILNRALWSRFEGRFLSKESTAARFDQLGELRNCIRHSRQVSEIVHKDGEAAILWFRGLVK